MFGACAFFNAKKINIYEFQLWPFKLLFELFSNAMHCGKIHLMLVADSSTIIKSTCFSTHFFGKLIDTCDFQIINVYNQKYESAGAFWPHIHTQIITSLLISHILLLGLLSTKKAAKSTPLLLVLPLLTFCFHKYCKSRFEPAFRRQSLEVNYSVKCLFLSNLYTSFSIVKQYMTCQTLSSWWCDRHTHCHIHHVSSTLFLLLICSFPREFSGRNA